MAPHKHKRKSIKQISLPTLIMEKYMTDQQPGTSHIGMIADQSPKLLDKVPVDTMTKASPDDPQLGTNSMATPETLPEDSAVDTMANSKPLPEDSDTWMFPTELVLPDGTVVSITADYDKQGANMDTSEGPQHDMATSEAFLTDTLVDNTGASETLHKDTQVDNTDASETLHEDPKLYNMATSEALPEDGDENIPVHNGDKFACNHCTKTFARKYNLERHLRTLDPNCTTYSCISCNKRYRDNTDYLNHVRITHRNNTYKCTMCAKLFKSRAGLAQHMNLHDGKVKFICPKCGKSFVYKSDYDYHLNLENGVKPHTCEKCNKGFRSPSNLRRHLTSCSNDGVSFNCNFCEKKIQI